MINILVTGGAGYIGSHVCKSLAKNGLNPVTLDNLSRGHKRNIKWGPFVNGSIHDVELVKKTLMDYKIQVVLHFAAFAYVEESVKNPNLYFENNFYGSLLLLEAMKEAKVRKIIFSSSCAIFGEATTETISETHPKNPINPYGLSKLLVENLLTKYQQQGQIDFCALRYFNAAGADPDGEIGECHDPEPHIIPNIISAAIRGSSVFVYGQDYPTPDGTCVRDFIHVSDLAEAHRFVLKEMIENKKIQPFYNLGNFRGYSILELIRTTEKVLNKKINYEFKDRRFGDPAQLIGSSVMIKKDLNWTPKHSALESLIDSAFKWQLSKKNL